MKWGGSIGKILTGGKKLERKKCQKSKLFSLEALYISHAYKYIIINITLMTIHATERL